MGGLGRIYIIEYRKTLKQINLLGILLKNKNLVVLHNTDPVEANSRISQDGKSNLSLFLSPLSLCLPDVLIVLEDIRQGIVYRVYLTVGTSFN